MAGNASDYLENALLRHIMGVAPWTAPGSLYLALYSSAPADAGGGTEIVGNGYVRMASGAWSVAGTNPTEATNTTLVEWPAATNAWGTVSHGALFDAASAGNMLYWFILTDTDFVTPLPKTVNKGDVFRMAVGQVKVRLD